MNILWLVFFGLVGLNFALLAFTVITSGLHEIRETKRLKAVRQRRASYMPGVTILVPAHNEKLVIERCLRSLATLRYNNFEVIVLNDGSKDETSELAQAAIERYGLPARVIDIYPGKGKGGALQYALTTQSLRELTMVIDADCVVYAHTVSNIVHYFEDTSVMAVNANVKISKESSLMAYFQQIEFLVGYYHKRHNSYTNSEFIIGGQGATYRTDIIKSVGGFRSNMQTEDIDLSMRIAALGNKTHRLVYAPDALLTTEAVPTLSSLFRQRYRWKFGALQAILQNKDLLFSFSDEHSKLLTWFRLPQALLGELRLPFDVLAMLIFIAVAVGTQSLFIFFGSYFTIVIYVGFVIASDKYTPTLEKVKLVLINAISYPLHMGMTLLNFVAAVKVLKNWSQVTGKTAASGAWTPPERIGRQQLS